MLNFLDAIRQCMYTNQKLGRVKRCSPMTMKDTEVRQLTELN